MIWDRLSRERSGVIYCFSCLYGPMVSCRVPCAANNYLVKSVPSGLPSIPHRFRPASHSVPYRYRRSIIGHTVYSSPALVVHRGPVQQLFVPARSRRKRRRPARMGTDQTRLEHRKRFQAMRPALCGRRVHVSAPLPPSYEGGRWGARMCPPPAHATRWETWRFALCGRHARVSAPPPPPRPGQCAPTGAARAMRAARALVSLADSLRAARLPVCLSGSLPHRLAGTRCG